MSSTERAALALLLSLLLLGACADDGAGDDETGAVDDSEAPDDSSATDDSQGEPAPPAAVEGYRSEVYGDPAHWLCRPDIDDACDTEMDTTVVEADGSTEVLPFEPAEDPPVDCFYVYPTISTDDSPNSDLVPGEDQEIFVVRNQAARLGAECRVFAPVYRQRTLAALSGAFADADADTRDVAYADVLDAWKHYLANDNDGRGVVLVGHSQGASLLNRLVAEELDGDEFQRDLLVPAYLLGSSVAVPEGAEVGGDFDNVPLCEAPDETGCVVSYASYRSTSPPPENGFFGRVDEDGQVAACTNPAALGGGGPVPLQGPTFPTSGASLFGDPGADPPTWTEGTEVITPFVTLPGLVEAECVDRDGFSYLGVAVLGDPADPRIDDIGGDLTPEWGLHLVDVNVAMGELVDLVRTQTAAYAG